MTTIHKLPQHLINKLKAGEIVERPASVVKELVENSLDAGATAIEIEVVDGGTKLLRITDNGVGLDPDDLELAVQRYATSKISTEHDLEHIQSYGFRGEALASISEVSVFRMQSKTKQAPLSVGHELYRSDDGFSLKEIPFAREQGTSIWIEDLFYNVPARKEFIKSTSTESSYISQIFLNYALVHYDKSRKLLVNNKVKWQVAPAASLMERIQDLFKTEWHEHLNPVAYKDEQLELFGVVSDAALHFSGTQYLYLFVNQRPVQDRLVKKAVIDAYYKQLAPGTYPFVVLFIDIDPSKVDVNVHPRKSEVKFLDPGSMFSLIKETIQKSTGENKVNYAAFTQSPIQQKQFSSGHGYNAGQGYGRGELAASTPLWFPSHEAVSNHKPQLLSDEQTVNTELAGEMVEIVGQVRDSYIVMESQSAIYYADQHALAERIAFEKMRKQVKEQGLQPEILLQPLTTRYPQDQEIDEKIQQLATMGFDIADFGENKVIVYAVPKVFVTYKMDIDLLLQQVQGMEELSFDLILDEILGMKACKASIKAGQKLSKLEMKQLIDDGMRYVEGMFVCQHGRPSVVKIEKKMIEGLFDR